VPFDWPTSTSGCAGVAVSMVAAVGALGGADAAGLADCDVHAAVRKTATTATPIRNIAQSPEHS